MIWNENRKALCNTAFKLWQGTPHRDRVSVVGKGVDCINFIRVVYKHCGIVDGRELGGYEIDVGAWAESSKLADAFARSLFVDEHAPGNPEFGDIVIFKNGEGRSSHCGLYADGRVWHSLARRCVTPSPWGHWKHRAGLLLRLTGTGYRADPKAITN